MVRVKRDAFSALDSGSSGSGSSSGQRHYVEFLRKTLYPQRTSLLPGQPDKIPGDNLRWTNGIASYPEEVAI